MKDVKYLILEMDNHIITGWNNNLHNTQYQVFCRYQGHSVPATYQPHKNEYECGGCCKKLELKNISGSTHTSDENVC